jgi:hypothetical protein
VTGLPTTEWDTLITTITSLHDHQREAELEANGLREAAMTEIGAQLSIRLTIAREAH